MRNAKITKLTKAIQTIKKYELLLEGQKQKDDWNGGETERTT